MPHCLLLMMKFYLNVKGIQVIKVTETIFIKRNGQKIPKIETIYICIITILGMLSLKSSFKILLKINAFPYMFINFIKNKVTNLNQQVKRNNYLEI